MYSLQDMESFQNYLLVAFERQAEHEACVAMLRQVISRSGDTIPAKWLLWPGHSEPAWKIKGLYVDYRQVNHQSPSYQIPFDSRQYPILENYKKRYQNIRNAQVDFYIWRPELHYRLKTSHTTNNEKLHFYISTNLDAIMNNHPDEGYFDVWERQPYAPSSPSESIIDQMWNKFIDGQWGPEATQEDIDSWGPQGTKEMDILKQAAQIWAENEKIPEPERWSDQATHGRSTNYSSNDSLPGLMEISPKIPSITPNSDSETPTLVQPQINHEKSLQKTATVYITQTTGELLFDKNPDPAIKESPPYSPAGDDTLWNELFPEPIRQAPSPNEVQELYNRIFPLSRKTQKQNLTSFQYNEPNTMETQRTELEELRERYKLVHQYTTLLDSPDSSNALHLSGVSTDPSIIISTIPSLLESTSPQEDYSMIEVTKNSIKEKGWDSLEDHITID
jgi:hypothetical protein